MVDLATLAIKVDATEVAGGVGKLDQLTAAGTKAEGAVDRLGDASAQTGAQVKTASQAAADYAQRAQLMAAASTGMATNVGRAGTASGLAAHHVQNLAFQAQDLFVGLASGQRPMTVFMQQGTQIAGIMQQAGIGVGGLAKQVGSSIVGFARAHPLLVGLGVAAGVAAGGMNRFLDSMNDQAATQKLAQSLGLTKKELKELGSVSVTAGDAFSGLWTTIKEALELGPIFDAVAGFASDAFSAVLHYGKIAAAGVYAGFVGGFNAIKSVWSALPGVIGEAAIGAANLAIKGIEFLINKAVAAFNLLITPINAMLATVGMSTIAPFTEVALPRIENAFAGATARMSEGFKGEFASAFDAAMANMDQFGADWERNTLAARDKRVRALASDIIGDRPEKSGGARKAKVAALTDEEKAYLAAMKAGQQYLNGLEEETAKIGKTAIEIKRMEIYAAAAAAPLDELKLAITKAGDAWVEATRAQDTKDFIKNTVEPLERQVSLLGQSAEAQARANLEAEKATTIAERGEEAWNRYFAAQSTLITDQFKTDGMERYLDYLNAIAEQSQTTADIMASAFGNVGSVIGSLIENFANYRVAEEAAAQEVAKGTKTQQQADKELGTLRARNTGQAISGIKSMFKEHSTAYKVMSAVEKVFAAIQLANTIKSMVLDTTKTASTVANSAVRTAANTAEGGSKIFASLGPFAFPVVAAMIAVMASLGFKGGSGGAVVAPPTAEELQENAGTGTILGDAAAKSESIANALTIVAENSNRDLEYSNGMLRALRSIDTNIGALSGNIAKQISVSGGMFDTSAAKIGSTGSGGILGLFASSTTRELYDLGLTLTSATVADIIANGITGQTYQIIQQVKKKSGFLGIGGSTKTTYETTNGSIDASITSSIADVVASLRAGMIEASSVLGIQGAAALIDAFQINIGKVSLSGMTGQEIEDQLNAIFSSVGDQMAGAVYPALAEMQLVGEGAFETFIRVARQYQVVDTSLEAIGKTFGAVGLASVKARDELVQLFGSLDEFASQTEFFGDKFLSEAEQIAPVMSAVREELDRLGLSGITTREQFKSAVLGIDLTSTAGRELYASLLAVAPAFDKVAKYAETATKKLTDGFSATVKEFEGYAKSLAKYRDTLRAGDLVGGNAYLTARRAFLTSAELAAQGDAGGLGGLESAGKSFLSAAKSNATSLTAYLRDVAMVASAVDKGIFAATETADYAQLQLDAMNNSASILASIDAGIANVEVLLGGTPAIVSAPAGTTAAAPQTQASNDAQIAELKASIAAHQALLTQITENTGATARILKRFDGNTGLLIATPQDEPLQVEISA